MLFNQNMCFQYEAFAKVYEATVLPVITYASAIWGQDIYSCILSVQNRASRYFLNVGRYTPISPETAAFGVYLPTFKKNRAAIFCTAFMHA